MKNDIATLAGAPRRITLGGREFQAYPLSLADVGRLQAWVDAQYGDPIAAVQRSLHLFDGNVAAQKFLLAEAIEATQRPRPRIGTPEADAMLASYEGVRELLYLSISKGDPSLTREGLGGIIGSLTVAQAMAALVVTDLAYLLGRDDADPKATATAGAAAGG